MRTVPPTEQTDGVDDLRGLADAAREGDASAFEELVRRTYRNTYTLALRLTRNEEDARDVTQESYLRAYKGLNRYRGDAQFETWLFRITANCASTHLKARSRHRHADLDGSPEPADRRADADVESQAGASDLRGRVDDALATLPPRLRAVVVLRDVYDFSHEEIASELGISVSAAKVRLHRARHSLRAQVFSAGDEVESRAV